MRANGGSTPNSPRAFRCSPKAASLFASDEQASPEIDREILAALPRDQWLLASLLQKSIRRGQSDYAAAAAIVLADLVPDYLARRLAVIAYEDVGIAAPSLLLFTKQVAASLPFLPPADRRDVSASLADRLANSVKSRAACDIVSLLEASNETTSHARELSRTDAVHWIAAVANSDLPLIRRAVALRFALGLGAGGVRPAKGQDKRSNALPALADQMQLPASVVAAVHAGGHTHNLNAALPLAYDLLHGGPPPVTSRQPNAAMRSAEANGLLLCAVDMFTRCGRAAYRTLARTNADLNRKLRHVAGDADPASVIGMLMFHLEGSLLDRARVSDAGAELLATVEAEEARGVGLANEEDARMLKRWLRRNAKLIDRARAEALANYLHPVKGTS